MPFYDVPAQGDGTAFNPFRPVIVTPNQSCDGGAAGFLVFTLTVVDGLVALTDPKGLSDACRKYGLNVTVVRTWWSIRQ